MEQNRNPPAEAATDEPASLSPAAPSGAELAAPCDPFNAEFGSEAEEAAYAAGLTEGLRILSREERRADGDPMRPRSNEMSAAEAFDPAGRRLRHDGWLGWKKAKFLEQLAAGAVVADACRSVGMSVGSAYALKNRRSGHVFGLVWDAILIHRARGRLAGETLSRAMNGCVEEVRRDGTVVGERRRFDNRLSMAVLTRLDRLAESKTGEEAEHLRSLSEDFEAYLDLVEEGGDEEAFVAAHLPAPARAEPAREERAVPAPEPGGDDQVWQDEEGSWWCAFPPPAGFDGREKGVYDGFGWYERTLTPLEQAVIDARLAAVSAEDRGMRDEYFGFPGDSASPSRGDGEAEWHSSTSSTSPPGEGAEPGAIWLDGADALEAGPMSTLASPPPSLASVSLTDSARDPEGFAHALGSSFERYGFAIIADHGIPADLIARAEEKAKAFFALPEAVKRGYHIAGGGGARGYTPFGIETAKGATNYDLKEFWHVGRELPEGHRFAELMAANVWPKEVPSFRDTFLQLFAAFDTAGLRILEAIARHLGLAPDYFEDTVADGNSVLRLLHYPPVPGDGPNVRAGAHEDINTITLLLGAEEAGLELLDRDGQWLPVSPNEGELVVNIGDMLQRLTNNVLRSTTHRVVNPPPERRGRSRYSMPFFLHFRPDFLIETLPECLEGRPNLYPEPITAHDFLLERLREIKLV